MSERKPRDFPLAEIGAACEKLIARGAFILQKWTCRGCGRRITGNGVNVLVHHGHCEHCGHVTDLDKQGCNYALIQPSWPMTIEEMQLLLQQPSVH